jgi:two-component system phosphate regulon sensor histidine kinase PhoR
VALAGWILLTRSLEEQALARLRESLATSLRLMSPGLRDALVRSPRIETLQPLAESLGAEAGFRVTVIAPDGTVLGESALSAAETAAMENHAARPEVREALAGGAGGSLRFSETLQRRMLYLTLPMRDGERLVGVVRAAVPLEQVAELERRIRRTVAISLAFGLGASLVLAAGLTRRVTRPLSRLTRLARSYASGAFPQGVPDGSMRVRFRSCELS